jgi:hypothetical protein
MKTLIKMFFILAMVIACLNTARAQNSKKDRQAAKTAGIKKMVDAGNYVFKADYANPMRGGQRALTSEYDLKVSKDTVAAFLPYFGRAYIAPADPTKGGIEFTCTNFDYTTKQAKNGNWDVVIKPKDKNINEMTDVQSMRLTITASGYASLNVTSSNRDAITFEGYIEKVKGRD